MNEMPHPLLEAVQTLAPQLKEKAAEHESQRHVDEGVIRELAELGCFRMLVPKEYGGGQVEPSVFASILETLGRYDAATGWCVMTGATTSMLSAYMPPDGAKKLWQEQPNVVMAGIFAPMGKAVAVEGGYRLQGRWPFASGVDNATWRMGGALVMEDGKPRIGEDGAPIIHSMFFPAGESDIIDTWSVSGLCGTGSHDIAVDDIFVPEELTTALIGAAPKVDGALYTFPVFGLLASGVSAVALGIGRAAIDELCSLSKKKRNPVTRRSLSEQSITQLQIAQAEALLQSAKLYLMDTLKQVYARAKGGAEMSLQDRALVRMAASHAVSSAASVVDDMYKLGGGTSIYKRNPLQRHFRDVHTITQHIMVSDQSMTASGKVLLGLKVNASQL